MKLKSGFEKQKARVEMLPLIDVVFLLLVFFIYAFLSMVLHRGLDVDLPDAAASVISRENYVDLSITADNQIFVNKQPVTLDSAAAAVRVARTAEEEPVFIHGDRQADLGIAVQLQDRLRIAGIEKVSFACTEKNN